MTRIVVTGSECTGKSTLAEALAGHYGVRFVPEFVRDFAVRLGRPIDFSDHGAIARGQMALQDAAAATDAPLIIQDTDLLSTVVYCRHYFGRCPPWIEEQAARRKPDLYLLCDLDVPWIADGVRDRGDRRRELQELFTEAVAASGALSVHIRGELSARLTSSIAAIADVSEARRP